MLPSANRDEVPPFRGRSGAGQIGPFSAGDHPVDRVPVAEWDLGQPCGVDVGVAQTQNCPLRLIGESSGKPKMISHDFLHTNVVLYRD
jgi:hypothetical protein